MSWVSDLFETEEDRATRFFDFAESVFNVLGYDTAADNLRRYRSGVGGIRSYSAQEMEAHPAYGDAIDRSRSNFETKTFTGRTGRSAFNDRLLGLQDGETIQMNDYWDGNIGLSQPSTYFAFGRSGLRSEGDFTATRNGDRLNIRGNVLSRMGTDKDKPELFDFNPLQIGYREGRFLEDMDEAKPFAMDYQRTQDVEAELQYEPDGSLTLLESLWGELK